MKKILCVFCLCLFMANAVNATVYSVGADKKSIKIKKGDKIVVVLKENPTTGYSWLMSISNPEDVCVLKEISKKFYTSNSKLLGASGCIRYTVKAKERGVATIEGINARPWEKNGDATFYKLDVTVK